MSASVVSRWASGLTAVAVSAAVVAAPAGAGVTWSGFSGFALARYNLSDVGSDTQPNSDAASSTLPTPQTVTAGSATASPVSAGFSNASADVSGSATINAAPFVLNASGGATADSSLEVVAGAEGGVGSLFAVNFAFTLTQPGTFSLDWSVGPDTLGLIRISDQSDGSFLLDLPNPPSVSESGSLAPGDYVFTVRTGSNFGFNNLAGSNDVSITRSVTSAWDFEVRAIPAPGAGLLAAAAAFAAGVRRRRGA